MRMLISVAAALLTTSSAMAAQFAFDFTGSTTTGQGLITTSDALNIYGAYDVTAISGIVNGATISGLLVNPNQPDGTFISGFGLYDNNLLTTAPFVTEFGIAFTLPAGRYVFYQSGVDEVGLYDVDNGGGNIDFGRLSVTAVPEPSSWAIFIVGFAAIGVAMRARRAGSAAEPQPTPCRTSDADISNALSPS